MVEIFKNRGEPFSVLSPREGEKEYSNLFIAEIANHSDSVDEVHFEIEGGNTADIEMLMPNNPVRLQGGDYVRQPITVKFSKKGLKAGKMKVFLTIHSHEAEGREEVTRKELTIVGPFTSF